MKKILTAAVVVLTLSFLEAQNYNSQNISLLGQWFNPAEQPEPVYGIKYQGIWGWHDSSNNREYAIIGSSSGSYFIDVTNPAAPVMCDYLPGRRNNCIWHEIKSYSHYAYIVSDDGSPNSFQIVDLQYLPDSIHVVHDSTNYFERSHTIYVDGDKLYCGSVTLANSGGYYSMAVYSLANPEQPQFLASLDQFYTTPATVHDMFVRNDTCYVSGGFDGLYIYKFDTINNSFIQLATMTSYPEQGYNHSSFLTADGKTLIFMDEVPAGLGIKALDVSSFSNLTITDVFRSNQGNTPHNPYIIGNGVLVGANYTDGVQIFNINNPSSVVRTGYFDTDTMINYPNYTQAYHGCWGAYTDLPSGILLASDMQNGLFVLDISQAILAGTDDIHENTVNMQAYPNPFSDQFSLNLYAEVAQTITVSITDAAGRTVSSSQMNIPQGPAIIDIRSAQLAAGNYTVHITSEHMHACAKLVKTTN